jgi:glycosyltransferase involved in cell wall biosynthesis
MRIALITPGFSADAADWCIPVLRDLAEWLAGRHEVRVYTLRYPHRQGQYQVGGAAVRAFGGRQAAGLARVSLLARAVARIVADGRRQPFDILHAFWADEPGFVASAAARALDAPAVVSVCGGELIALPEIGYGGRLSRMNRLLAGRALRGAACVTAGSELVRGLLQPGVPPERRQVLPFGVVLRGFEPPPPGARGRSRQRLLHVGSLVGVKDQATLLGAFALALRERPQTELELVGEGPLRAELERLAGHLGIADRVIFGGGVPHDQLPARYQAADLYVHSSRYESQGMTVLEAAACGLAHAATTVGVIPELAGAGLHVPVGAHQQLAGAIVDLLADDDLRQRMGLAARRLVEARYSLDTSAAQLEALYRDAQ